MLGVGIHIHFRPDTTVELDTLRGPGKPRILIANNGDASVTIFAGIEGLNALYLAIGNYLADHYSPAAPPIPADAATDDSEADSPSACPRCGSSRIVRITPAGGNGPSGWGGRCKDCGETWSDDAPADAATDDDESLPPGWHAREYGYEHDSGDWVDTTDGSGKAVAHTASGGTLVRLRMPCGGFRDALNAMEALDIHRDDSDDDTTEFDTRDILAALDEADRAALFAPPEVP